MNNSISVIVPLYNKALFIKRAIDSILHQTVQDFEIVVLDDCSTDDGVDIVKSYADERIGSLGIAVTPPICGGRINSKKWNERD